MKLAVCGQVQFAKQIQQAFSDFEIKFCVEEFTDNPGGDFEAIKFFDFRRMILNKDLDGIIVALLYPVYSRNVVRICKLNGIKNIAFPVAPFGYYQLCWLEEDRIFIPYFEVNLIDVCNLNCKGCTHFANLFAHDRDVYPIENFRRDIKKISELADVLTFRLLGGEPLLIKNIDEYISVSRHFLPQTRLELVTNGLLIPSLSQKILDSIKSNKIIVSVSNYKPTMQNIDKIKSVLEANGILYSIGDVIEKFWVFLTLNGRNDPNKSRTACMSDTCRFLRNGKIYKCPCDALSYKFAERFNLKNFPAPTSADIYAQNFSSIFDSLDGAVEMCHWCSEQNRKISWEQRNNPELSDWLFDPDEMNFHFKEEEFL